MTMTKADLAEVLCNSLLLSKREAAAIVDAFFAEIGLALENGEEVKLSGFGCFHLRNKPPRLGRNPKTGEETTIDPRRVSTFRASPKLRMAVEQHRSSA